MLNRLFKWMSGQTARTDSHGKASPSASKGQTPVPRAPAPATNRSRAGAPRQPSALQQPALPASRPARNGSRKGAAADTHAHSHPAAALGLSKQRISFAALRTCEELQQAGFAAYIVGGGVRDLLLGREPKDFDVATDAAPEEVLHVFRRARLIGRRFRIVHVMFGRETIEVTTFRAAQTNGQTDAHGRMLNDNEFGTRDEDALRRDFTVNALYYDPIAETLVDPLGGVQDLNARLLRMIGDPATRYREDPVRMLRTVRFAAKLDFQVDPPTLKPIRRLAPLLENVPPARIFDEIMKLLESGHGLACIQRLRHEGLHHGILPLLDTIFETDEGFVTQALTRTDERVQQGKSVSPSFLFAALLWPQVRVRWEAARARGEHVVPALDLAITSVLDEQGVKLSLQRRYQADMREIWMMQPRLEKRGRQAFTLITQLRFRAGYDFLLLRAGAGELDSTMADWWTAFTTGNHDERERLVKESLANAPKGSGNRKRRRRRSKGAAAGGEGGDSSDVAGSGAAAGAVDTTVMAPLPPVSGAAV